MAFLSLSAVVLCAAVLVVAARTTVHSAVWLIVCFLALAGIFLMLGAEFVAAVQVIIYAGSVVVLFVFAVMTLGLGGKTARPRPEEWAALILLGLVILGELAVGLRTLSSPATLCEVPEIPAGQVMSGLAGLLFGEWLLPLEVFSLIILAAMVGAAALHRERGGGRR